MGDMELSEPAEAIIKGEIHTSRGDLREEREILAEGVDTLIIEGEKEEADLGILHGWFGVAMIIFEYLFVRFLYTDHQTLVDIAKGQGADVVYTRETDAELITNSHGIVVGLAFALFYGFLITSAIVGLLDHTIAGASFLLASGLTPVLVLRLHETLKRDANRDKRIADDIINAVEDGGRVVAVMGEQHFKNVPDYLPQEMDTDLRPPKYGMFSLTMARDLALPVVRLCGMLSIVYPVFLFVADLSLALAA